MASLGSVSSSSNTVSSLMNSANMISGLASGLDTEGMIESLVKSYQTKINQLNQKVTKVEWKQEAYRNIISQMYNFSQKYTSYTSNTNLTSPSFFSSAVKVLTKGIFADSVTASGKTSSDISLNAVHQLATAAQYRTKSSLVNSDTGIISGSEVDLFSTDPADQIQLSNLKGGLTLTYGSKTVSISFNEANDVDLIKDARSKLVKAAVADGKTADSVTDTDVLAEVINQKLAGQTITFTNGSSESADKRIQATANADGRIVFEELGTGKNGVYISGASGNVGEQLGLKEEDLKDAAEKKITVIDTNAIKSEDGTKGLTRSLSGIEYLAEKSAAAGVGGVKMNMSLDGSTKQITMPDVRVVKKDDGNQYYLNGEKVTEEEFANKYTAALQDEVKKAFGDKVKVENKSTDGKLQLEFKVKNDGSELITNSDVGDALGFGNTATSYLNTSKTLKDLIGSDGDGGLKMTGLEAVKDDKGEYVLDDKGKKQYDFVLNGVTIGTYTEDTKLSTIMSDINSNTDAGVKVAYSQATQNFTFTARETGADSKIEFGDGLAQSIFGDTDIPDRNDESFAKIYGMDWMTLDGMDGRKEELSVQVGGAEYKFDITNKTTISEVVNKLNDGFNAQYTFSYNKYSGQIEAEDKQSGATVNFGITDSSGDAVKFDTKYKPDVSYTPGQDAKFTVTINGEQKTMTRSSNSVGIDGLTINMTEEFDGSYNADGTQNLDALGNPVYKNSVTFQSKTDSDKIIDAIKSMVSDYNAMMAEIKSAYGTMPYQKSDGSFGNYEPLTEEDRAGMTESAIERYEEKAKQGILFGDRNLSALYNKLNQAFSFANKADVDTLKDMGISVGFSINDGTQAVTIDEDKLRAMLDSDPDRVADLFTKTDGIMDRVKTQLDIYGKTTGEPKGILVQQSGTPLSSLSLMSNQWQKEIDNYNTQIEKWQDKLANQVERYTSQFSRLELLIQQMNSQSSTLAGMMGGG